MEEKKKQIKNSILYMAPMLVSNILPLISMPIFTRILTKEDYGVFALAQVYATFVVGISNFGLSIGYERNFFQYKDAKSTAQLLYSTLVFVTAALLLSAIFTYFFRTHLSQWIIGSTNYGNLLFWAFCSVCIVSIKNYYLTYFKNMEDAKAFVRYTIDESILGLVFSLFLVAYLRIGVIGLVWGQLMASLIILTILCLTFIKRYPPVFSRKILMDSLEISLPLTPRILFGVIGNQFDKYMIGLLGTLGGVGVYSIGQKVSYMVFSYMTALQNVYSPQVYKRMFELKDKGGESIGHYLTPFAYLSVACALLVASFSEEVIVILTPASYHGAVEIVVVFSMFYCSLFFGKQPQLVFAKKTHLISLMTLAGIAFNVLINVPLIMKLGAIGAAWGTFAAGMLNSLIFFRISQKYYKIKWEYGKLTYIFSLFFTASISIILLKHFSIDYIIRLIIKSFFLLGYLYLGIKLNVINRQVFSMMRGLSSFNR